jgi:hypothetical protein
MRILFFCVGTTGSGHIVLGLSVAAALRHFNLTFDTNGAAELVRRLCSLK